MQAPQTPAPPPRQSRPDHASARKHGRLTGWLPADAAWWGGAGFLRLHASILLAAIPALFLVNLILAPDRLWIGRIGLAWLALLIVHAAIAGIVWGIGILQQDAPRPAPAAAPPMAGWMAARPVAEAPTRASDAAWTVEAPTESSVPQWPGAAGEAGPQPTMTPTSGAGIWDGWTANVRPSGFLATSSTRPHPAPSNTATPPRPAPSAPSPDPDSSERVSWRAVAEAAWLAPPGDEAADSRPADRP